MNEFIIADICGTKFAEINVCKNCLNKAVRKLYEENLSIFNKLEETQKEIRESHLYTFEEYFESNVNNYMFEATMSCMKNIEAILDKNGSVDEIKSLIVNLVTLGESTKLFDN